MKKPILFFLLSLMIVSFASAQDTTKINGFRTSSTTICAGTTFNLNASVNTGWMPGDSLIWKQQIVGVPGIVTFLRTVYTVSTVVTIPRDPANPTAILPAAMGTTYYYTLIVKRGGVNLTPTANITISVDASPTVGGVSFTPPACSDGNMLVTISGLSSTLPSTIRIYDDGILPANVVSTQTVTGPNASYSIHYWSTNGDISNLYLQVELPSTGCKIWK